MKLSKGNSSLKKTLTTDVSAKERQILFLSGQGVKVLEKKFRTEVPTKARNNLF